MYQQYYPNEDIKGKVVENKIQIDHIDRNPSNNDISNLRIATHSQQQYNKDKKDDATSKYFGVNKIQKGSNAGKWFLYFRIPGGTYYKPYEIFDNEERAGRAYDRYVIDNGLNDGYRRLNNIPKKQVVIKKKNEEEMINLIGTMV